MRKRPHEAAFAYYTIAFNHCKGINYAVFADFGVEADKGGIRVHDGDPLPHQLFVDAAAHDLIGLGQV